MEEGISGVEQHAKGSGAKETWVLEGEKKEQCSETQGGRDGTC